MIAPASATEPITLALTITDAECLSELMAREEGPERDFFALSALRVGVLSLPVSVGVVICVFYSFINGVARGPRQHARRHAFGLHLCSG